MSDARQTITVIVKWWVPLYLGAVVLFAKTFRTYPNVDKVASFVAEHGLRIR